MKLSDTAIARLWRRMTALYGHKWQSVYGDVSDEKGALTDTAKIWVTELVGVNYQQIVTGISRLGNYYPDWPPTVFKFKELCLAGENEGIPSVEQVIRILTTLTQPSTGLSIADRFKHPLVLAVSKQIDMFALRTAKQVDAVKMVKPIYQQLLMSGWQDFSDIDFFRDEVRQLLGWLIKT
ncbi:hypothetical protein [Methylocucumis oryzae]|uniref:Uncharacterized protein n=1 Tax=Methylocucumis oryzae TaxID=1632867 RepID=A0A0F3IMQ0_9GAMM|nr:hypothetical protein [Methylocucumis oryzae]KJV08015.1 hypothetical protein VZ94_00955 [Methylocucumis oryzae]